jgi:hypothetical protein
MKIFRSGDQQRSESPGRWVVLSDGARPTEDLYFFSCVSGPFREQLALDAGRVDTRSRWQAKYFRPHRLFGANILICRSLPEVWIELRSRKLSICSTMTLLLVLDPTTCLAPIENDWAESCANNGQGF